jgi:arsenate reductase
MSNYKQRVLFLCTGNSCRSQMAEGFLRHLAGSRFDVFSAGTHPSRVNPQVIQTMAEIKVDISGHRSKSLDEYLNQKFDYVITVCDSMRESCPVFPNSKKSLHWSFEDPAVATGFKEDVMGVFRRVRDQIHQQIVKFLKELGVEVGVVSPQ